MTTLLSGRDLAELVRLPAALTVPGDVWSGHAGLGTPVSGAGALPVGSVLLYWSGMALNDWADRDVDAVERPERVIPSGRITPPAALAVATGLGLAGVAVTGWAGGRRALRVSVPLAVLVATYDVVAKDTVAGPVVMASTRGLDVLLGASAEPAAALGPAVAAVAHTAGVTGLSRGEVHGTGRAAVLGALAGTATAAVLVGTAALRTRDLRRHHRGAALALTTAYALGVGRAQARTLSAPDAATVRAATGAGIGGITLLQAAWLAARGRVGTAAVVAGAAPLLRRLARTVSPT